MNDLTDDQLRELASGAAEEELARRARGRERQQRQQAEQAREQAAWEAFASLETETLKKIARDPRTESDSRRRKLWESVPSEWWSAGLSKDDAVYTAQSIVAQRVEENDRKRIQANAPSLSGVPPWVKIAGGAVVAGVVLDHV